MKFLSRITTILKCAEN